MRRMGGTYLYTYLGKYLVMMVEVQMLSIHVLP